MALRVRLSWLAALAAAAALIIIATSGCGSEEPGTAASGKLPAAPALDLPAAGDGVVSLGQLNAAGEVVVVFYRGFF